MTDRKRWKSGARNFWQIVWLSLALQCRANAIAPPVSKANDSRVAQQWTYPFATGQNNGGYVFLVATPHTLLLQADGSVTALNRQTGAKLWETRAALIGTASGKTRNVVILAEQVRKLQNTDGDKAFFEVRERLKAVDASSGLPLWQESLPLDQNPEGVRAIGVFVGVILVAEETGRVPIHFRDAATGVWLDPSQPAAALRLKEVARQAPDLLAWQRVLKQAGWRRLVIEWTASFLPEIGIYKFPVLKIANARQVITSVDMDNGRVGGSSDPKYLECADLAGRRLWRFPVKFRYVSSGEVSVEPRSEQAKRSSQVENFRLLDHAGMLVARDAADTTYWLRLRDGKRLWPKLFQGLYVLDAVAYRKDILAQTARLSAKKNGLDSFALWRVNGLTGIPRKIASFKGTDLMVDGNTLFVLDYNGQQYKVTAYTLL